MRFKIILFLFTIFFSKTVRSGPDTIELLAKLIHVEGDGEPFSGKLAIGTVVYNISDVKNLPLDSVLRSGKLFSGLRGKKYNTIPSPESYLAAIIIKMGHRQFPKNIIYYYNPKYSTNIKWVAIIEKNRYIVIGRHIFCFEPKYKDII